MKNTMVLYRKIGNKMKKIIFSISLGYAVITGFSSLLFAAQLRDVTGEAGSPQYDAAINVNFDRVKDGLANTVNKTGTQTIVGEKTFEGTQNFEDIVADSIDATDGAIDNIDSSSVGTNQIAYDNGTKLVGSSNLTYNGTTLGFTGTLSLVGTFDGWVGANETWTYATAQTFTVSGDVTAKYTKGTRLKFTQTTVKYAVVVGSSYGAPNTTVTILTNTDYTIANAAITSPYYSYMDPQGYPDYFAIAAPTFDTADIDNGTGGVQPTTTRHVGKVTGKTFIAEYHGSGVKNGAGRTFAITAISSYPTQATGNTTRAVLGIGDCTASSINTVDEGGRLMKTAGAGGYIFVVESSADISNNDPIDSLTWKIQYEY